MIIFAFLVPLFFMPITAESYEYQKNSLLVFSSLILILLFALNIAIEGKLLLVDNNYSTVFVLLGALYIASTFVQSPNMTVALTTPLGTLTVISCLVLFFSVNTFIQGKTASVLLHMMSISATIISTLVILSSFGIISKSSLTPAGNMLSTMLFLIPMTVFILMKLIGEIIKGIRTKIGEEEAGILILYAISLLISGSAVFILAHQYFTAQNILVLPYRIGWMILAEVIKDIKTIFLGVGPSNFISAFTLAKPPIINSTSYWNIIFTNSSSYLLNLATEVGIFAAFIYILIIIKSFKNIIIIKHQTPDALSITAKFTLFIVLILGIFLPSNMTMFVLTVILLAISGKGKHRTLDLSMVKNALWGIFITLCVISLIGAYFYGRSYMAEVNFKKALDYLVNKDLTNAYNFQRLAIDLNPYIDRFRVAISQTSLAMANGLASKEELTDEDKQNIPKLAQQAIDQARMAVILYQTNAVNWDNLAKTYGSLVNFAAGSQDWAIKTYQQRITLDPLSPIARIAFGGFYLAQNKPDEAEKLFRIAVTLKPDLANAHYNLAIALRDQNKFSEALAEMEIAGKLLDPNSQDSKRVATEIDELKKKTPTLEEKTENQQPKESDNQQLDENTDIPKLPDISITPQITLPQPPITQSE